MATVELAIVIPTLVAVLALCLSGLGLAVDQIRCVDAARLASRAAARGEPVEEVIEAVRHAAPADAEIEVHITGDRVRVVVTGPPRHRYLTGLPRPTATVEALLEPAARMGSP